MIFYFGENCELNLLSRRRLYFLRMPFFSNLPWREFSYHMTQAQTRLTPQCKKLLYIGGRSHHHHPPPSPWLYIMWQWVYLCHSRLGRNVRNEHVFGSSTHLLNKRQEAFLSSPLKKSLPCPICHSSMQRVAKKKRLCCVPLRAPEKLHKHHYHLLCAYLWLWTVLFRQSPAYLLDSLSLWNRESRRASCCSNIRNHAADTFSQETRCAGLIGRRKAITQQHMEGDVNAKSLL